MKITKVRVKENNERYSAQHYRNVYNGMLHKVSNNEFVDTGKHLDNINNSTKALDKSFIDRLVVPKESKNYDSAVHNFLQKIFKDKKIGDAKEKFIQNLNGNTKKYKACLSLSDEGQKFCNGKLKEIVGKVASNNIFYKDTGNIDNSINKMLEKIQNSMNPENGFNIDKLIVPRDDANYNDKVYFFIQDVKNDKDSVKQNLESYQLVEKMTDDDLLNKAYMALSSKGKAFFTKEERKIIFENIITGQKITADDEKKIITDMQSVASDHKEQIRKSIINNNINVDPSSRLRQYFINSFVVSKDDVNYNDRVHDFIHKLCISNIDISKLKKYPLKNVATEQDVQQTLSAEGRAFCDGKLSKVITAFATNDIKGITQNDLGCIKQKINEATLSSISEDNANLYERYSDYNNGNPNCSRNIFEKNINENYNQKRLSHGEWLVQFIANNSINDERFKTFERLFQYDELSCKLTECLKKYKTELNKLNSIEEGDKEGQKQIRQYKKDCLIEIHDIYKQHEVKHYKDKEGESTKKHEMYFAYYIREVREYFNHYFPLQNNTRKQSINKRDITNFITYIDKYANIEKIKTIVKYQILNKLTSQLILEGKLAYFSDSFDQFTSDDLELIHVQEAFKKQLMTSILWATNRLRFIMLGEQDTAQLGDILLQGNFDKALDMVKSNKCETIKKLKWFLNGIDGTNDTDDTDDKTSVLLTNIHNAIYYTHRNNIYHFSKEYFLEDKNFYIDGNDQLTKDLYDNDKDSVKVAFKEKIRSMNLYTCYPSEVHSAILGKISFSLSHPNISIIPSFKNVYNKGKSLQNGNDGAKRSQGKGIQGLEWFVLPAEDEKKLLNSSEEVRVYRNFLQLIYEYEFLPSIYEFLPSINKTEITNLEGLHESAIELNKESAKKRQVEAKKPKINNNEFKYEIIETFGNDFFKNAPQGEFSKEDCEEYFRKLQSLMVKKENENQESKDKGTLKPGSDKDKNIYVDFVRDLYVFAFNQFLENNYSQVKDGLTHPQYNKDNEFECCELKIDADSLPEQAPQLYLMARLLDADQLNDLRHQFIRYNGSIKDIYKDEKDIASKVKEIIDILTMVNLTSVNYTEDLKIFLGGNDDSNQKQQEKCEELYKPFMNGDVKKLWGEESSQDLYVQQGGTPILHKGIGVAYRSGCFDLYKVLYSKAVSNKINKKDCEDYLAYNNTNEGAIKSNIEEAQQNREELHKKIVEKEFNDLPYDYKISNINDYEIVAKKVDSYNKLRNKVTFNDLYSLGQLHRDILSRFIGFAVDWERDMHFLLISLTKYGLMKEAKENPKYINKTIVEFISDKFFNHENGGAASNICEEFRKNEKLKELFKELYQSNNIDSFYKMFDIRNWVAHLNHIQPGSKTDRSLVDAINDLRKLLSYDRKRKNAVTKAIIEMMEKEKIRLTFESDCGHDFKLYKVESEQITHLKKISIKQYKNGKNQLTSMSFDIPARSEEFCKLVEQLFDWKA